MKKIQDYYFKLAQKQGYPARSVYKLEEAQKKYRLLRKGDKVLDLGCQPGSWSMYAAKTIGPRGLVVGVDLNKGKTIHVNGGANVETLCGDIMDDAVIAALKERSSSFQVILSDMAPRTTGNKWADQQHSLMLARRVLTLAESLLARGGNLYCKVFEGEDFKDFFTDMRTYFKMAKIFKPKSSRSESREVFVLGMGFD